MKKSKSILCCILVLLTVFASALPALATEKCQCGHSPIIYVIGRTDIYDDKDNPQRSIASSLNKDKLMEKVTECLPLVAKALFLGQWDEYYDKFFSYIDEFFGNYAPDANGEITDNSGSLFKWNEQSLSKAHNDVNIYTYRFEYDARLSPLDVADDLNDYIEAVKRVTGHDKVSVICRCVGVNYAFAYLYKYQQAIDYEGLDSLVIYDSALKGVDILEAFFSGNIEFDKDSAGVYLNDLEIGDEEDPLIQFLKQTIAMLNDTYGMDVAVSFLNTFCQKLKSDGFIDELVRKTFGYTAGYWSMIYNDYEATKDFVFGEYKSESKKLIAKLDDFHYHVQLQAENTILAMKAKGIDVNIICKYGYQTPPLNSSCFSVSDDMVSVARQSFGATTAQFGKTLGSQYLNYCYQHNLDEYISPDKQIDAFTCLLPENTWFIKYYHHNPFWDEINTMLKALCYQDGIKVGSDKRFFRYSRFQFGSLPVELTKDNCFNEGETLTDPDASTAKKSLLSVIKALFDYLKILFAFLKTQM